MQISIWRCRLGVAVVALLTLLTLLTGCGESDAGLPAATSAPRAPAIVPAPAVTLPRLGPGVHPVDLIVEPDDRVSPLSRAIRDANTSVRLEMYELTNPTLVRALEYAHASGVDVRVILEPHPYGASSTINQTAYDNLMAADIPVRWSSPRYLLTHQKSMVVDNAVAYVMTTKGPPGNKGINYPPVSSVDSAKNWDVYPLTPPNFTRAAFKANREFDVVDRNPRDVASVAAVFEADWTGRAYTPRDPNLPLSPLDARPMLTALVGSARHTLDVYAEELQDPAMEAALAAAARRGARVRLILPAPKGVDRDAAGIAAITRAGARVYRAGGLYIHAKAIVVDGRRAFVGSQNLSPASLDHNRELGVIINDRDAIATLEQTFASDWNAA